MTNGGRRQPAGDLIAAALPQEEHGQGFRTVARRIVDGEHPGVNGVTRHALIERWRRYLQRWVKKPVQYLAPQNAVIVERYLPPLRAADLTKPELTAEDLRRREIQRLERKARALRRQLGRQ